MSGWLAPFLSSLAAGFLSSLGLGGGGILVLYLTVFQGMNQTEAGGINLLFFLPVAAVSIAIHLKNRQIDWRMALRCAPFGVASALAGAWLAHAVGPYWLGKVFALFVLALGGRELFAKEKPPHPPAE